MMQNLKDYFQKTMANAPYIKTVRVKVIASEPAKDYINDRNEERQLKMASIADSEIAMKLYVYDPLKFHYLEPDKCLLIRNFIPKGDSLAATRNTKVFECGDVFVPDDIRIKARDLLFPPPPPVTTLKNAKTSPLKLRLSVRGKVVQENISHEVQVKGKTVPIRTITLKEGKETCKLTLWREIANQEITTGDNLLVTNVVLNNYNNEISLSSTSLTTIQKGPEEKQEITTTIVAYNIMEETGTIDIVVEDEDITDLKLPFAVYKDAFSLDDDDIIDEHLRGEMQRNASFRFTIQGEKVISITEN